MSIVFSLIVFVVIVCVNKKSKKNIIKSVDESTPSTAAHTSMESSSGSLTKFSYNHILAEGLTNLKLAVTPNKYLPKSF